MGFSTIFGGIMFIFIFISMILFVVSMQKNLTSQAQAQSIAAARQRNQEHMALTVTGATYSDSPVVSWTDTTYADFARGTATNTVVVSPGTVTLVSAPYSNGTWTSPIIDTGFTGTNYTTIGWSATLPGSTAVAFQTRAGASTAAVQAATFTGPDGTAATTYTMSGTSLNDTVNDQNRYIQYIAYLGTNNNANTPQLRDVHIGVQRFTGVTQITAQNTGSEKLAYNNTDIYIDGIRVSRATTDRTFDYGSATDQVLWLPGVQLTLYVFGDITTPAPITIANSAAQGAGTVN